MRRRIFIQHTGLMTAGLALTKPFKLMALTRPAADLAYPPFVRWWWNGDKIEKEELARELRLLKDAGIGGVEINPIRFPARTDDMHIPALQWLSPEWIALLDFTLTETKKLDMTCDLLVSSGWPFGGPTLEQDERSQMLTIAARNVKGPSLYEVSVFELLKDADPQLASPFDGRTAELVSLCLVPSPVNDLYAATDLCHEVTDGILKCHVPEGDYTIYALVKMTGFMQVIYGAPGAGGPVLNHYNQQAVANFLNRMSGAITSQIGPLKGRLRAFFCDSLELEGANWCHDMAAEFQNRRGYELMPWLPFILFKTGYMGDTMELNYGAAFSPEFGQQVERVRYDFELTKTELFKERFIDTFTGWCKANGVLSRMQAYGRGYLPLEGSFAPDIPECETWLKYGIGKELTVQKYPLGRAYTIVNKYVSSAAHLQGKRQISCEELTNTEMVFFESLETLKIAADQSTISGVTHSIFHGFNYSPKEAPFPGWVRYGCYFNEHNTWWPYFKLFTAYKARLSGLLQQGDMYADIAVLSPTADLWKRYSAQNDPFPQSVYPAYQPMVWEVIHQNGSGCDYVSEPLIQNSDMKNGNLHYGKRSYKALLLIAVESMEPATAKKLLEFVRNGGTVFCIEKIPDRSTGWKDSGSQDQQLTAQIAELNNYNQRFIRVDAPQTDIVAWYRQLQERYPVLKPYLKIDRPNSFISQLRYQTADADLIYLTNSDSVQGYSLNLEPALAAGRQAWLLDLESGERLPFERSDRISLDLGPADAKMLVFDRNKPKGLWAKPPMLNNAKTFPAAWALEGKHINGHSLTAWLDEPKDIKDIPGWEDFCGTLHYRATLQGSSGSNYLDLGKVEGLSAVLLNGQDLGTKWYGRRRYPLALKPGENQLEVIVTTTMGNYMKSLNDNPVAQYWTNSPQKNQPLQPTGLLGPVFLYTLRMLIVLLFLAGGTLRAQTVKPDTAKAPVKHDPPYYGEFFCKQQPARKEGLLTVLKINNRYFLELKDSLMGKDILCVSRMIRSAAGLRSHTSMLGYGGDEIDENEIRFEKAPNGKIAIRQISYGELSADSTQSMYRSVDNSNLQSIAALFDIRALAKNKDGVIIDVTDYLEGDNDLLFFNPYNKKNLNIAGYQPDKSYIETVNTYPNNTEIKTVKTYTLAPSRPGDPPPGGTVSVELNCSMILLPAVPMRPREADDRIGYFRNSYEDFDADPQNVKNIQTIDRWRLEPRPEDMEKYKRGELVEPQKQIVFYIDPATPKKWVPYLIQGVNDWQKAFEQAGFKNAIIGKVAPTKAEDSTWSLEDARNSAIIWKSSLVPNASGPNVHDPRTGEILESHINWYHAVLRLVHNWYMIQCAATDPRARKMEFDDELMGQLIRFVASHEVGHTLGLRHNFGASTTVPVDSLRNNAWLTANGHCPSIMDYARFNYVAQPEEHIEEKNLFPRIGDYDKWAIEWGYRLYPGQSPDQEKTTLNQLTIQKLKNKRLIFVREDNDDDPRAQSEDLGDDAMQASLYGIKNLKYILANLNEWTKTPNEGYDNLKEMYGELLGQYSRYMGHVTRNVGGIYENPKTVEQPGPIYTVESKEKQQRAIAFLNSELFAAPLWLLNKEILADVGYNPVSILNGLQQGPLNDLLSTGSLRRLIKEQALVGSKAYTIGGLFLDLDKGIWQNMAHADVYRRNLQKAYISDLGKLTVSPKEDQEPPAFDPTGSDISSLARAELLKLQREASAALLLAKNRETKAHLQDISQRISRILNGKINETI